jgi:hypothetical protein
LSDNIPSGSYKSININKWKYIVSNAKIKVHDSRNNFLIGESTMTTPENKTIKALHCGMVSGHSDISDISEITKSPLGGNSLSRLRIINVTPRDLNLTTTGGNNLHIPSGKSLLYWGEYEKGVEMGVTFKDVDNILPDYNISIPITDLFMGIISDIEIPLYRGAKIGGEYFDEPGMLYHPLQEINNYQTHIGSLIDKSYVPKNW